MLELIMVLSAVLRKASDQVGVSGLLIVNAGLRFCPGTSRVLSRQLRKRPQVSARALRDAAWQVIPARELVPGDIIRVRSGDI
jgi:H+-transporting ATPase